jgi:glycine/D-amino acid oxidase-like deaminating enzyme
MKYVPFWTDDYPRPEDLPVAGRLPAATEVLIVGAGITGLNAARVLRRNGIDTVVVDAGRVGAGASTVNGGQVNYGLKAATTTVYKEFGEDLGRRFWDASLASIDLVEEIVKSESIDCAFLRPGAAELGYREKDLELFYEEAEWLSSKVGFELEIVGPDRVHEVIDSPKFYCAAVDSVGASLHPARYTYGLAEAAAGAGASLVENAPVNGISRRNGRFRAETPRGTIDADNVLIATNGYTGPLKPDLQRRVLPVGSYIVATEPLDADFAEMLIPRSRAFWTARRFLNYFRRSPDNRILMGGRNNLATDLDLGESAGYLREILDDIFPQLRDKALTHSWTGRLGVTFDLMPHIGQVEGVWYALGYGGHGVGIGTYLGSEVGRMLAGEIDDSPFAQIPHPKKWFYRGRPWFYPLAAGWYRFLDRIGR